MILHSFLMFSTLLRASSFQNYIRFKSMENIRKKDIFLNEKSNFHHARMLCRRKIPLKSMTQGLLDPSFLDNSIKTKRLQKKIRLFQSQEAAAFEFIRTSVSRDIASFESGVISIEKIPQESDLKSNGNEQNSKILASINNGNLEMEASSLMLAMGDFQEKHIELLITIRGEERSDQRKQGARHVVNEIRPPSELSEERETALITQLKKIGIDPEHLMEDEFIGSSPLRAYRSFVRPRAKTSEISLHRLDRTAEAIAHQIAFLLRHHEATQAEFFRNSDIVLDEHQKKNLKTNPIKIVLDNLRSAYNVGSIFRTAETAGIEEVITCGITPSSKHPKIAKTACSATQYVESRHFPSTKEAISKIKAEGFTIFGMETTALSQVYTDVVFPLKSAFILGNEVTGVDISVLKLCDGLIEIPTFGAKNSLNVASACPIVVYEAIRQWKCKVKQ